MLDRPMPQVPGSMRDHASSWNGLVVAILRHAADVPTHLAAAAAVAPDSPALIAAKGIALLLLGRAEPARDAAALLPLARAALRPDSCASDRAYVEALAAWLSGAPSRAAAIFDEHLAARPGDALALKFSQAIRFLHGDEAGLRASAFAAIGGFAEDHPHLGYALGCHAFALEEGMDYAAAERSGRAALDLAPDDAWGLHAVAHVYEMTGRPRDGRRLVADTPTAYGHCSTFRHHVLWHAALFELELGDTAAALALYDAEVRAARTDDYRDVANAVSLLARLEGEGVDVGERWDELADIAERRTADARIAFADLHYMLALLGARRDGAAGLLAARMAGPGDASEAARTILDVGGPAAIGLCALWQARHDDAVVGLLAARRQMQAIGGSHAQRDVFERITIDAALAAGRPRLAERMIGERGVRRGEDRFARTRLARCRLPASPATMAAAGLWW